MKEGLSEEEKKEATDFVLDAWENYKQKHCRVIFIYNNSIAIVYNDMFPIEMIMQKIENEKYMRYYKFEWNKELIPVNIN